MARNCLHLPTYVFVIGVHDAYCLKSPVCFFALLTAAGVQEALVKILSMTVICFADHPFLSSLYYLLLAVCFWQGYIIIGVEFILTTSVTQISLHQCLISVSIALYLLVLMFLLFIL